MSKPSSRPAAKLSDDELDRAISQAMLESKNNLGSLAFPSEYMKYYQAHSQYDELVKLRSENHRLHEEIAMMRRTWSPPGTMSTERSLMARIGELEARLEEMQQANQALNSLVDDLMGGTE